MERVEGEVSLELMYARLDCDTVERVQLTSTTDMWLDEEGILKGRPVNVLATELAASFGFTHQLYVGPALVCACTPDGASVGMNWDTARQLQEFCGRLPTLLMPTRTVPTLNTAPDFRTRGGHL